MEKVVCVRRKCSCGSRIRCEDDFLCDDCREDKISRDYKRRNRDESNDLYY
jgi:hypothetical protein